jgi:hypothetical protein
MDDRRCDAARTWRNSVRGVPALSVTEILPQMECVHIVGIGMEFLGGL